MWYDNNRFADDRVPKLAGLFRVYVSRIHYLFSFISFSCRLRRGNFIFVIVYCFSDRNADRLSITSRLLGPNGILSYNTREAKIFYVIAALTQILIIVSLSFVSTSSSGFVEFFLFSSQLLVIIGFMYLMLRYAVYSD